MPRDGVEDAGMTTDTKFWIGGMGCLILGVFALSMGVKSVGLCVIGMTFFGFSEEGRRVRSVEA
ncbi:hypothetical protein Spith_1591 [Spirochaeta thermophila DSM 6578]|uniref:Uncharacterized protein n=1 Tax=Winmispira thermophila (strain ATCC 700085 / DSM 6578 / Z-1203) TaxID=869211 RepID=G0GAV6_WINT7|nr:hypothetical protein Spith_1591 [Spirochaeta thermophila DSM 6578]